MTETSGRTYDKVVRALEAFRGMDPEMPMQSALILTLVAREPDISHSDILRRVGLTKAAVSRNMDKLGRGGLGLLRSYEDLSDRRNKRARLTAKGESAMKTVATLLGG